MADRNMTYEPTEPVTHGTDPLPDTMQATVMRTFGDPHVLRQEWVDAPRPSAGEVVVAVSAVEVSRNRDVATRGGQHPFSRQVTLPHVLGGDFSGVVAAVGSDVDAALLGRRVAVMNHYTCGRCAACSAGQAEECSRLGMIGIHRWGSYAEFTSVPVANVHLLPDTLSLVEAAALAATGPIGLTQLRTANVGVGSTVVVTGMTGALATTLAALAGMLGANVIGLSRRGEQAIPGPGLTVLDSARTDLTDAILAAAALTSALGRPEAVIDNVCDPVVFDRYFPALANGARIVVSGAIPAPEMPTLAVPARELYSHSISVLGLRSHTGPVTEEFWQLVADGFRLPSGVIHEYPIASAPEVHQAILDGSTAGHTILRVSDTLA